MYLRYLGASREPHRIRFLYLVESLTSTLHRSTSELCRSVTFTSLAACRNCVDLDNSINFNALILSLDETKALMDKMETLVVESSFAGRV